MIRLFVALAIPDATARALANLAEGIPGARWSSTEQLHLTLRFAGEIDEAAAGDFDEALANLTAPAVDVTLAGVGAFGEARSLNAVWAGVEANPDLTRLHRACETAARRSGLKPERRRWVPHVTLAYLRGASEAKVAAWIQHFNLLRLPPFRADRFHLYSSWLGQGGSAYRIERTYPLGGA